MGGGALAQHRSLIHNTGVLPTLGTSLIEAINRRGHSYEDAADALGVSASDVESWAGDRQVPVAKDFDRLLGYLEVDLEELQGLILRSQMLQAQRQIHGIPAA